MNERTPPMLITPTVGNTRPAAAETETAPTMVAEAALVEGEAPARLRLDPTRYGDWELNGKCVDF